MCYSKEDGGQRCSYHTGAALERAQADYDAALLGGDKALIKEATKARYSATLEYATTPLGRSFVARHVELSGREGAVASRILEVADRLAAERRRRTELVIPRPVYPDSSVQNDPLVVAARDLAFDAHASVRRRSGEPYIRHPQRVAENLAKVGHDAEVVSAAWLHDTAEDTWVTLDYLDQAGFPPVVVRAVDAVTHRSGEYYYESVARAAEDEIGLVVKMSDNQDNTHPEPTPPERFVRRQQAVRKYGRARTLLSEVAFGQESSSRLPYTIAPSRPYYSRKPETFTP